MSTCTICMDSRINVIFNGCHHACCCQTCADQLLDIKTTPECPQCRAKLVVDGSQEIYSLFYLNGVDDSPSGEGESKSESDSELRDKLSEQSKKLRELQQQLQLVKQKEATQVDSVPSPFIRPIESYIRPIESYIRPSSNVLQGRSPPRRGPSGYQLFVKDFFRTHPNINGSEFMRSAGEEWKTLPYPSKQIWFNRAREAML